MKKQKTIAFILLLLLLPCLVLPVSANSAQQYWMGTDGAGAVITDGDSPIVVENELLTFDLNEFPSNYYNEKTGFLAYTGKVTAEYTFYNPSDMTVTATLAFPFGDLPHYSTGGDGVDLNKYGVTVNGEEIEATVRHTPSLFSYSSKRQFDLEGSLELLSDDYITSGIYSPDTAVTVYYWKVEYNIPSGEKIQNPTIACDISKGDGERAIYLPKQGCGHVQEDGDYRIGVRSGYTSPILYVIGEPLEDLPQWRVYKDGGCEDGEELNADISLYETKSMTLLEFALEKRDEDSAVSDVDWYNSIVFNLLGNTKGEGYPTVSLDTISSLMRWYKYEITLNPGDRLVNTVTAPMYPSIDLSYVPAVYGYTYLVSPASTWRDFGELKIVINTPYYLTECSYTGFERTEGGYELTIDGLPRDEEGAVRDLTFSLSTGENPVPRSKTPSGILKNIVYFFLFYWPFLLLGLIVLIIIIIIFRRKRR